MMKSLGAYVEKRPLKDIQVIIALVDDNVESVRTLLKEKPIDCRMMVVSRTVIRIVPSGRRPSFL